MYLEERLARRTGSNEFRAALEPGCLSLLLSLSLSSLLLLPFRCLLLHVFSPPVPLPPPSLLLLPSPAPLPSLPSGFTPCFPSLQILSLFSAPSFIHPFSLSSAPPHFSFSFLSSFASYSSGTIEGWDKEIFWMPSRVGGWPQGRGSVWMFALCSCACVWTHVCVCLHACTCVCVSLSLKPPLTQKERETQFDSKRHTHAHTHLSPHQTVSGGVVLTTLSVSHWGGNS